MAFTITTFLHTKHIMDAVGLAGNVIAAGNVSKIKDETTMKILHVCNWASGITTRNVVGLKAHSVHSHELVTRIIHPYDMALEPTWLTEANTEKDQILGLAEEADVLHFHVTGYAGTDRLPETIHGINWGQFLARKPFIAHGMCSCLDGGKFILGQGMFELFGLRDLEHYTGVMGPHLSCKISYDQRLQYVPDIVPINDWLYTPLKGEKKKIAATFKEPHMVEQCARKNINLRLLPTPTKLTWNLDWRRKNCRATFDNSRDGHWGLFGIESLAQGIPCATYTHEMNRECWKILQVPSPPFAEISYGAYDLPEVLGKIMDMSEPEWLMYSQDCRLWIEMFYNPKRLVKRWDEAYKEILG